METTATRSTGSKAPAHLWVVGIVALLWNAFGCFDFVMTNVRDPSYLAQLPPDMIDFIDAFPAWVIAAWSVGVWGALAGSVLLLARSLWAAYAFALSLLGLAATQFYQLVAGLPDSMNSPMNWTMTAIIWIIAIGLLLYALRMRSRGVLR